MKAVIWGYRYDNMRENWYRQMQWVINSLLKYGVEVKPHGNFKCRGISSLPKYDFATDKEIDICIYNHTYESKIIGDVLQVRQNWFFKPTVPDENHTTLDELGYGPYSSITYKKPDFENLDIGNYFDTTVKTWIDNKCNKWGKTCELKDVSIPEDNYYLILGQCGGDSVVTEMDFGSYFCKVEQVIRELVRVGNRDIVVKLHPYTDGVEGEKDFVPDSRFSLSLKKKFESISTKVKVYLGKISIHHFIKKAYCVLLANSGAGIEVMMHHKPMITWGLPEYHWVTYDLRHLCDLKNALDLSWFDVTKQDKFLYWYTEKYCFCNQQTTDIRVKELLSKLTTFKTVLYDFPDSLKDKTIALVGGAQSLIGSNNGKEIDSHDIVVRVGEPFVSGKTNPTDTGRKTDYLYLTKSFVPQFIIDSSSNYTIVEASRPIQEVRNLFSIPTINNKPYMITTGMYSLLDILKCNPKHVKMFGFDFYNTPGIHGEKGCNVECNDVVFSQIDYHSGKIDKALLKFLIACGHPIQMDQILNSIIKE